jgi:hypothetical protein
VFATADGHITVVAAAQPLWESLCRVIGREDLNQDPRFASSGARINHVKELEAVLIPIFQAETTETWLARLDAARVPTSPVLELEEILAHPHLRRRGTAVTPPEGAAAVQRVIPAPIRMAETPVRVHRAAPAGADTEAALAHLHAGKDGRRMPVRSAALGRRAEAVADVDTRWVLAYAAGLGFDRALCLDDAQPGAGRAADLLHRDRMDPVGRHEPGLPAWA